MADPREKGATSLVAALYARNDPCLPEFYTELSAAYAPDYMGAAVWNGLHTNYLHLHLHPGLLVQLRARAMTRPYHTTFALRLH